MSDQPLPDAIEQAIERYFMAVVLMVETGDRAAYTVALSNLRTAIRLMTEQATYVDEEGFISTSDLRRIRDLMTGREAKP